MPWLDEEAEWDEDDEESRDLLRRLARALGLEPTAETTDQRDDDYVE